MRKLDDLEELLVKLDKMEIKFATSLRDVRVLRRYREYQAAFPEKKEKEIRQMVGVDFSLSPQSVCHIYYIKLYRVKKYLEEEND